VVNESKPKCPATSSWDPYDTAFRSDPFPTYARFREECPVGHCEQYGGFWAISRYEDVRRMAEDSEAFSSAHGVALPPFPFKGRALPMESDPPEHEDLRRILQREFSLTAIAAREDMVREAARELIAGFAHRGRADFSKDYAKVLPTAVICQLLGIEALDRQFQEWAEAIVYNRKNPAAGLQAMASIRAYFEELIPRRKANLGNDFISLLLKARVDGKPLDDETIHDFCWFLVIAGLDNTAFTIRNVLLQVHRDPDLRRKVIAQPELIKDVVEEILRLYSPVWGIARTIVRDADVQGQILSEGDKILLLYASANRDGEKFPDPDRFDIERNSKNHHVAFGAGRHRCLGLNLARMEIRVAVEEIIARLPNYQVTAEVGWNEMGPLPVTF
jgi:cytochrome P450